MNKNIFIACDTTNLDQIRKIINETKTKKLKIGYKFGLEFFYSKLGRSFLSKINKNKTIFLDLKLNDIPNTCSAAIASLKDLKNIKYLTVHINGGYEMLKAVKKSARKINKNLKILGVTILTSLNDKSIKQIGHTKKIKQLVLKQADLIKKSNCDGIVCSAQEAKAVRKKYKNLLIVTPGIRLPGDNSDDQRRIMTPKDAFKNKVSGIVLGRSLTKGNIKNNTKRLLDHLKK